MTDYPGDVLSAETVRGFQDDYAEQAGDMVVDALQAVADSHEALRQIAETHITVLDRDGLTVLDLALSHLADIVRLHPDALPSPELKQRAKDMHDRVLTLKRLWA